MSIRTESIKRVLIKRGETPRQITVWLAYEDEGANFNCVYCKRTIFRHKRRIVALLPNNYEHQLAEPPISIQCQKCGCIYNVQGVI